MAATVPSTSSACCICCWPSRCCLRSHDPANGSWQDRQLGTVRGLKAVQNTHCTTSHPLQRMHCWRPQRLGWLHCPHGMADAITWGETACLQNLQRTSCPSSGAPQHVHERTFWFMAGKMDLYVTAAAAQAWPARVSRSRIPLNQAVLDPGYTPRARDLDALVDLLAEDALVKPVERALARIGEAAAAAASGRAGGPSDPGGQAGAAAAENVARALQRRFEGATPPLRARVLRALGRYAGDPQVQALLVTALRDEDPKTRRNAAMALGQAGQVGQAGHAGPVGEASIAAETALLAAWQSDPRVEMRRTIAASLGKVGGPRSAALLAEASQAEDAELARIAGKSSLMVGRTVTRPDRGHVDGERPPAQPLTVDVLSREGLEELLAQELLDVAALQDVHVIAPGRVRARLSGPLSALFAARTMLAFAFPLPTEWTPDDATLEDVVARAVTSDAARTAFDAFTRGAVRYRLAWGDGGHRRATTWRLAQVIAERARAAGFELVNDPTASLWEVLVTEDRRFVDVSLAPRGLPDPRFTYRLGDVPAASHPTIAAALARVAGARDGDVVWDPFVGSGSELVERARLGPYRSLHGSDLDPRALAVARKNLDAAGLPAATLEAGDAMTQRPPGVTLVITNPPMGRRLARTRGLADTLDAFVAHVATVLPVGGRMAWVTSWGARGRAAAERAGMALEWARSIDMGGFDAEMQRFARVR